MSLDLICWSYIIILSFVWIILPGRLSVSQIWLLFQDPFLFGNIWVGWIVRILIVKYVSYWLCVNYSERFSYSVIQRLLACFSVVYMRYLFYELFLVSVERVLSLFVSFSQAMLLLPAVVCVSHIYVCSSHDMLYTPGTSRLNSDSALSGKCLTIVVDFCSFLKRYGAYHLEHFFWMMRGIFFVYVILKFCVWVFV